jgi:hypothetical protein
MIKSGIKRAKINALFFKFALYIMAQDKTIPTVSLFILRNQTDKAELMPPVIRDDEEPKIQLTANSN